MGRNNLSLVYPRLMVFIAEKTFDISLLLYFCSFLIFNNELVDVTSYDSILRTISSLLLFSSGFFLVVSHSDVYLPKLSYVCTYILFVSFAVSSCIWAKDTENVFNVVPSLIRILILAFIIPARIKKIKDFNIIFNIYIIAIIVKAVIIWFMMSALYGEEITSQRFGDSFGYNPNDTAVTSICAISFLLYYLFDESKKAKFIIEIICVIFLLVVIFLTQSKKGIIGISVLPVIYIYYLKRPIRRYIPVFLVIFSFIIIIAYSGALENSFEGGIERMENMIGDDSSKDNSTLMREKLVQSAIDLWSDNPIFGAGLNNFAIYFGESREYYSHNNYTEILSGLGVVGFVLYYIPILFYVVRVRRSWNFPLALLLKSLVIVLLFLDVGNVSYQSFSIQVLYVLLSIMPYFYYKAFVRTANNEIRKN